MVKTITLLAGQVSEIESIAPGTRITSSGNGSIEWVAGSLSDAKNAATWTVWAKGSAAGYMDSVRQLCIRATATGSMTVTIEESKNDLVADDAYWDSEYARVVGGVLMGPDGHIPLYLKSLTVETSNINNVGARPSGADWLFSAARDLATFIRYLQFEPTIFFDPDDTTSLNYGTEEEPYNTLADVNRVMVGNRAGTALGIKYGSHLYTHGTMTGYGLNITCYGTATNPVWIVPYGDPSLPMPIIDGSEVTGDGTSFPWVAHNANVWKIESAVTANTDVFENDVRCDKKDSLPAVAGECQYTGGVLYYWPRSTSNPNDGSIRIPYTQWPVQYEVPNVAAQMGNVKIVGIEIRYGRGNNFRSTRNGTSVAAVTGMGAIDILFCRLKNNGFDATAYTGFTGSQTSLSFAGIDATHRIGTSETISSRVIGCDISGSPHHAIEFSQQDNSLCEYNYLHDCWGAAVEYYVDCSGNTFRNNKCENFHGYGRLAVAADPKGSFALLYNNTQATPGAALAFDATHALNVNNKVYNNWFKNCGQVMFAVTGGAGHAIYNNTCDIDHDAIFVNSEGVAQDVNVSLPSGLNTKRASGPEPRGGVGESAANGFITFSNNILYYRYSPVCKAGTGYLSPAFILIEALAVNSAIPVGNNNVYVNQTNVAYATWQYPTSTANFGTYKAALAAYSLDVNSLCIYGTAHPIAGGTYGNASATAGDKKTLEQLLYTEATGKPSTSSPLIQGGANVNANRLTDYIGQTVIAVGTPAIGCYER